MVERIELVARDGEPLSGLLVRAEGDAERAILVAHGIQSHAEWFTRSAKHLAARGTHVVLMDRRGSGRSSGARGDIGSERTLLDDVSDWANYVDRTLGIARVGLVGISWGAKLVSEWHRKNAYRSAGLLLSAPGVLPSVRVDPITFVRFGLAFLLYRGRRFRIGISESKLLTDNEEKQRFVDDDDLKLKSATVRFYLASRQLDLSLKSLAKNTLGSPVVVVLAARDALVDNKRTRAWAERVCQAARVVEIDAMHTLEFEKNNAPYLDELARFCEALDG